MSVEDVAVQLKEHCECFADSSESDLLRVSIELVKQISLSTGWSLDTCETLLSSVRTQSMDMPCLTDSCCPKILRYRPYYQAGIKPESLKVYVVTQVGISTTRVEVDSSDFSVTDINEYFEFLVDLSKYASRCGCQGRCDLTRIFFEYEAGYDVLPDCLFPEVCEIAKTITASRLGCGSIDECCAAKQASVGSRLKSKKVGELSWVWEKDTDTLAYLYDQLVVSNKFKALSEISLRGTEPDKFSGVWAVYSDNSRRLYEPGGKRLNGFCGVNDCTI